MKRYNRVPDDGKWHWWYEPRNYNRWAKPRDFWIELLPCLHLYRCNKDIEIYICWLFWGVEINYKQSLPF